MKYFLRLCTIAILFGSIITSGCTGCNNRKERMDEATLNTEKQDALNNDSDNSEREISKAVFFIENSESMFGYVSGFTEYVDVISELAEKPSFIEEKTQRVFKFINGGENLKITPISNTDDLKTKLNKNGFNCGDITKSNLNKMFQRALEKARKDTISILISDGIYDLGKNSPKNTLSLEGNQTRSQFIERFEEGDLQTIMIKLHSHFDGDYFPVKGGEIYIEQIRPYYIWIFGETELLNRYFSEEYIKSLKAYADMARFIKFDELNIPFQAVSKKMKGSIKFDRQDKNILNDVEPDRNGQGFQFSFVTDFSSLPYSDSYFKTTSNYSCSDESYKVTSVTEIKKPIHGVTFTHTHLITVSTQNISYCELNVSLKSVVQEWIDLTNAPDEKNIKNDTTQTIGFNYLTDAISEAYEYKNKETNITSFTFGINK